MERMSSILKFVNGYNDLASRHRKGIPNFLYEGPSDEICRCRINTDLRNHNTAICFRRLLIFLDHLGNPSNFPSNIQIMGSILSTSLESMLSIECVWANSRYEKFCFLRKCIQIRIAKVADFNG